MQRQAIEARPDWQARVEEVGFTYHTSGSDPSDVDGVYWYEGACYRFGLDEVLAIESATEELHRICLEAVTRVVETPALLKRFAIPEAYHEYIRRSWARRDPHVMGRFDLAYDPLTRAVKMLEYNADTPTLVIETAVVQWFWLQDRFPKFDQFNSLHEKLIERYREIGSRLPAGETLHFSSLPDYPEEYQHVLYFRDLAEQAGLKTSYCPITELGYDEPNRTFVDMHDQPVRFWSKLYPWEWLAGEAYGQHLLADTVGCLEPVWKMILSNKAILPVLWQMFPEHPNLLPAYFEADNPLVRSGAYVAKPILAREGANIRLARVGMPDLTTPGSYGGNPLIYQALATLPKFADQHVVIGSWVVGDEAAGMILRESAGPIVVNTSRVVPHYIKD